MPRVHVDKFNEDLAKAVLRADTGLTTAERLHLARKFDPNIESLNHGMAEDYRRYEESVIPRYPGSVPKKQISTKIEISATGDMYVNTFSGDDRISTRKIERGAK